MYFGMPPCFAFLPVLGRDADALRHAALGSWYFLGACIGGGRCTSATSALALTFVFPGFLALRLDGRVEDMLAGGRREFCQDLRPSCRRRAAPVGGQGCSGWRGDQGKNQAKRVHEWESTIGTEPFVPTWTGGCACPPVHGGAPQWRARLLRLERRRRAGSRSALSLDERGWLEGRRRRRTATKWRWSAGWRKGKLAGHELVVVVVGSPALVVVVVLIFSALMVVCGGSDLEVSDAEFVQGVL